MLLYHLVKITDFEIGEQVRIVLTRKFHCHLVVCQSCNSSHVFHDFCLIMKSQKKNDPVI